MAAVELATAYVSMAVSTKGLGKDVIKQFSGVEKQAEQTGRSAGSKLMSGLAGVAKKTAVGAGIAAGAAVGAAVVSGFSTAMARDKSQRVMSGLYGNAKLATQTLADLRKVAHDSPIDYVNFSKAGESLAYAGVEGKRAVKVLDGVGKSIVVAGGGSEKLDQAMGGILKAVNNGGIAMMDSISMISESGYPIMDGLSEKFGVTSDVIKKMASQGKISIEDVLDVMENSTGKLAQANNKAYDSVVQGFGDSWKSAKDIVSNAVADVILPLLEKIAPAIRPAAEALAKGISDLPAIFQTIADAGGKVWNVLKDWSPVIFGIVGAFAAYNVVVGITNGIMVAQRVIASGWLTLTGLQIAALNGLALAQGVLNRVMMMNPIGLIVGALVLLVGGLVMAYNKVGWFRDFIDAVWAGIKVAAQAVGDWFMNTLWPGMKAALDGIGNAASWLYENAIKPAWDGIKTAIDVVAGWFTGTVAPNVKSTTDGIGGVFTWLYENIVKPVFDGIGFVIGAWWNGVKIIFGFVQSIITKFVVPAFQKIFEIVSFVFKLAGAIISTTWNGAIKPIFDAIVKFIITGLVANFNALKFVVNTVWNAIKSAIGIVWNWLKVNVFQPIMDWITAKIINPFNNMRARVNATWNLLKALLYVGWSYIKANVFAPIMDWVQTRVVGSFNKMRDGINSIWNKVKNLLRDGWNYIKGKIFDPLNNFIKNDVPNAFEKGKDAIGKAWDKVKEVAKTPIKFVIETVINKGIIDKFRDVGKFFNMDEKDLPTRVALPKGFDTGGYTGPGRKMKPAGIVHADEYVIRKQAQRKITRNHGRGVLDHMNRFGTIPGYSGGGMVWNNLWGIIKQQFPWARLTSSYRGGSRTVSGNTSYHASGRAVDLAGRGSMNMGDMMKIFNWIHDNYGQSSELIHTPAGGRQIKNGKHYRYGGGVAKQHYNHVHWANATKFGGPTASASGGAQGEGSGISLDFLTGAFTKLKEGLNSQFEKFGPVGSVVKSAASWGIERPIKWITDNISKVAGFVSDVTEKVTGGITKGIAFGKGQAWAAANGVSGADRDAMNWIVSKESGWNPTAKNPRSTASGLPQFINATSREYLGSAPASKFGVWKQLDGMKKYVAARYGGWQGAVRFWKKHNYYDKGGQVRPTLFDKGGVLQPGTSLVANKTKRPEYILPSRVTDALMTGNVVGGRGEEHFHFHGPDADAAMRSYESTRRRREILEVR